MDEIKKACQSCWQAQIEYLTPIDPECDAPLIMGIDYQYKCKMHDMIVPKDYYCDNFELPF